MLRNWILRVIIVGAWLIPGYYLSLFVYIFAAPTIVPLTSEIILFFVAPADHYRIDGGTHFAGSIFIVYAVLTIAVALSVFHFFSNNKSTWKHFVRNALEAFLLLLVFAQVFVFINYVDLRSQYNQKEPRMPVLQATEGYQIQPEKDSLAYNVQILERARDATERYLESGDLVAYREALAQTHFLEELSFGAGDDSGGYGWTRVYADNFEASFDSGELYDLITDATPSARRNELARRLEAAIEAQISKLKTKSANVSISQLEKEHQQSYDMYMKEYEKKYAAWKKLVPPTLMDAYRFSNPFDGLLRSDI